MIVVNYSQAFKALDRHIVQYNDQVPNNKKIKASVIHTAQEIIKEYGRWLIKRNGIKSLNKADLLGFRTNNPHLSSLAKSSPRTIQRHILRLIEAGIIREKIFHGTNSSYELILNGEIIIPTEKLVDKSVGKLESRSTCTNKLNTDNLILKKNKTTKCPNRDTSNNSYNNIINEVDKWITSINTANPNQNTGYSTSNKIWRSAESRNKDLAITGNKKTGNTREKCLGFIEEAREKVSITRAEVSGQYEEKEASTKARDTSLKFYAFSLWKLAKNILYKEKYLTQQQEDTAIRLLYQWYEPVNNANLSRVHQIYIERIYLVKKYIDKDPQRRYVQLPQRYFDPNNRYGFTGTKKWHEIFKARQKDVQEQLVLHGQIKRYLNNQKRNSIEQKPPLQLFRQCEQRIRNLKNPILLEQFHAAIIAPTSYKEMYMN